VTPTVHITGNTNQICAGVSNTLTAQTTNLGTLTNYYWYVNNNLMFNNSPIFTLSSLQNGDKVKLTVLTYSNCQTTNTTSDSVIVSVYPVVIPTAALTCINPCPGAPTQFNLTATNTGSSPTYSWFVNNVNQSNNTTSLTLPNPQNGDVVYCTVNSSQVCALPSSVTSNSIAIVPYVTPTLALSSVDNQSCFGDTIHFVASGTNGGFSPSYQWSVNGLPISNTGTTFKSASLSNESLVRCVMTSNANCLTNSTASSNIIPALVNYCNGISLRMLIQGFYIGNHKMSPVLYNNGLSSNPHDVDTITVALHDQFDPSVKVFEKQTILKDSGYANVFFENLPYNESYYISVKHRNSIETWSNSPITMKNDVRFSFSTDQYRGVKDIDGNVYDTISIGTQVWFKSNLNTSKYRDGAVIQNASLASDWTIACQTNKGAWCYYNNDSTGSFVNGKLYNWYAVNDTALCPVGWHVPTTNDWTILANYLGGTSVAGGKLKETGLSHFININTGATNSSGFTGLPSGFRIMSFPNIVFAEKFNIGQFWESNTKAYNSIQSYNTSLTRFGTAVSNYMGTSVRCVKD
jgi:uncharacterized protein (TIGR02145 family)